MSFTYSAGTSTPTYAGLVEFNGVRINDGSFRSDHLGGLVDTPNVRGAVTPLPSDSGGFAGQAYLDPRQITIDGWVYTDLADDVFGGTDYLRGIFTLGDGSLKTLVCQQRQWTTRRQCLARVAGPVVFTEPDISHKKVGVRYFSIPLVAPDPVLYDADNSQSTALPMDNSHITLTNSGTVGVGFTARFTGPWNTAASLIDNTTGNLITLGSAGTPLSLTAGQYIDVQVNPAVPGGVTATKNDGTNEYGAITAFTLNQLLPGSNSWRAAGSSGTTGASQVTVTWRNGWA